MTRPASLRSRRVSMPSPGPTSSTRSSPVIPETRTIMRAVAASVRKFWESRFLTERGGVSRACRMERLRDMGVLRTEQSNRERAIRLDPCRWHDAERTEPPKGALGLRADAVRRQSLGFCAQPDEERGAHA